MKEKIQIIELIRTKKYADAEDLVNLLLKKGHIDHELFFLSGVIKANQKKYIEAKNLLEKFLQKSNEHFDGNLNLVASFLKSEQKEKKSGNASRGGQSNK